MSGSMLAGTAEHRFQSMETDLDIEADVDAEAVDALVTQAEKMCFVLDAIERPHEVTRRTSLNGSPLDR